MKDIVGKEITLGATLRDKEGRELEVIKGDFEGGIYGEGPDLIADGGFRKTLINLMTVQINEFAVIDKT